MTQHRRGIGNVVAPWRFLLFAGALAGAGAFAIPAYGWRHGFMLGFDAAALLFLLSCIPLLSSRPDKMRRAACENDANRLVLLVVTGAVALAVLVAIATELRLGEAGHPHSLALILTTLVLCWTFSNAIYTLHYAHLFYRQGERGDSGGLEFPEAPEPDYWDFIYFAFCLGMTFQTSDVSVTTRQLRKVVTLHCLAAFVFNLGVLAFTINVVGG